MPSRLSAETLADMKRMLRNGSTFKATAYECDVQEATVSRWARKWGITAPPPAMHPRTLEAVQRVREGMSFNAVARLLKMDLMCVIRACKRHGVQSAYVTGGKRRVAA